MPPKEGSQRDKRQMSLMQVFRAAHAAGDARKQDAALKDGERDLTKRSRQRRDGVDERTLRRELSLDLGNLMNTVRLDATIDLDDWPHIRKSVINYGFDDLSSLSNSTMTLSAVKEAIRKTIIAFEPRLIANTVEIVVNTEHEDDPEQKLCFDISADLAADPVDIPLDFVAEVDVGAGKMQMKRIKG